MSFLDFRNFNWRAIALFAALLVGRPFGAFAQSETDAKPEAPKASAGNDHGIPQVRRINDEIRQVWEDNKLRPSAPASDAEWCRRVFLDVLGRVPSVNELRDFHKESGDKKAKLVNKLLYDSAFTEDYARNWTTIWTNILVGRNGGLERRSLINREGMMKYLRDSFAREKPYNTMVYELITATGSTTPGKADFNGATNFLVMKLDENAAQATAMTSKIFLGLQVQCTQCHNHPFNEWKQQKFWEMNAFFRQTSIVREFAQGGRDVSNVQLVNRDFRGEGASGSGANEAIIYYELRNGLLQSAFPVFVDGTEISRSGYVTECERRKELGKLALQSPFLDKTVANRMWQHYLGYAFTKPVDDLGPHNNPSHPALLEFLGEEVRKHSYNLKELTRWIVLSEPYSLSSKITTSNKADDPLLGETPKFSHFYLRQMQAEELYQSLLTATRADQLALPAAEQEKLREDWMRQFIVAFGNDEGEESTTFNGTIPQALMLMNGELMKKAIEAKEGSYISKLAASSIKPGEKVSYLFEAALSRKPTQNEIGIANQLLVREMERAYPKGKAKAKGKNDGPAIDPAAHALQDIFWAVLNSNEFILQH